MHGDDVECPKCKTTKYRDPHLVLFVNSCGHPLCEKCIELMFAKGIAKCYQCPTPLKRANFKKQLFQDSGVERDIQVRKDILRKFSRNHDAFGSLREYNDYLEKLETVIFNLANDLDPDATSLLLDELRKPLSTAVKQERAKQEPYYHEPLVFEMEGPSLPELDDRFMKAVRSFSRAEIAGGFTANLAIRRALSEAFAGLFTKC